MTDEQKPAKFTKRIKNASITEVFIGFTETGVLTSWVVLNFGPKHQQGFGGLPFTLTDVQSSQITFTNTAAIFISNLLNVIGVQQVNDLIGKAVRVYHDTDHVYALGHFTLDQWFDLESQKINQREHPEGVSVKIDEDGKKHYGLEVDTGQIGAKIQELKQN